MTQKRFVKMTLFISIEKHRLSNEPIFSTLVFFVPWQPRIRLIANKANKMERKCWQINHFYCNFFSQQFAVANVQSWVGSFLLLHRYLILNLLLFHEAFLLFDAAATNVSDAFEKWKQACLKYWKQMLWALLSLKICLLLELKWQIQAFITIWKGTSVI